jgi:hypothetical protein
MAKYAVAWCIYELWLDIVEAENEYDALLKSWLKHNPYDLRLLALNGGYSKAKRIEDVKESEVKEYLLFEYGNNDVIVKKCDEEAES